MKRLMAGLAVLATMTCGTAVHAQSNIDDLRNSCMDSSRAPEDRLQACNDLSNAITQAAASGNYSGNAIVDTGNAQAAAMRAAADARQAAQRNAAQAGSRSNSASNSMNKCDQWNARLSRQGAGVAC